MSNEPDRLSLCVIARDEEANLPRLLASVEGLVDEIVVADTGSVDATVAIAQRAGARVCPFEWCDDFSAAYNHSLDHATGEWVLLLDADEELAPGSHDEVRRLIRSEEAFAYTMLRQDYYGDQPTEHGYTEILQTRLFRRRDSVRFVGRIHQQLEPRLTECALAEGRRTLASDVRFRHYGYLGDYTGKKMPRTIQLLELELAERPDSFYYLVELGRAKNITGDPSSADILRRAAEQIATGEEPTHARSASLAMLLENLLACDVLPDDFPLSMARAEQIAIDFFSDSIPLIWQRALKRFKENDFAESARLLERILTLAEQQSYSRLVSFRPGIMHGDALLNLGVCYTRMARFKQAVACFERLKHDPQHAKAAEDNLKALKKLRGKG